MYVKTFLIFLAGLQFAVSETYDKVNLTYVYETRCPFCVEFVNDQFYSGYKKVSDYINLELVIVVSSIDEQGAITCQHGDNECFISKAQACAFGRPGVTELLRVEYLHCTEEKAAQGKDVVDADIKACVKSVLADVVSYETVQTCMTSIESANLLKEYKAKVVDYDVHFVPWLGFFGVYNETEEQQLRSNFVATICSKLSNPPTVCTDRTYLLT